MSSEGDNSRLLQIRSDLSQWDKYIDECDSIDLSDTNRQDARKAFHALRKELGEAFLENALATRHPIVGTLLNRVPWTRKWFVTFSAAIQEMKPHTNYQSLLDRLRSA